MAIPTLTHLTLTRFSLRQSHADKPDLGCHQLSHILRMLLNHENFPLLQSLVLRDARESQDSEVAASRRLRNGGPTTAMQDSRLRFEDMPGGFDWSHPGEAIAAYTCQQWEEAVYQQRGPWGRL